MWWVLQERWTVRVLIIVGRAGWWEKIVARGPKSLCWESDRDLGYRAHWLRRLQAPCSFRNPQKHFSSDKRQNNSEKTEDLVGLGGRSRPGSVSTPVTCLTGTQFELLQTQVSRLQNVVFTSSLAHSCPSTRWAAFCLRQTSNVFSIATCDSSPQPRSPGSFGPFPVYKLLTHL